MLPSVKRPSPLRQIAKASHKLPFMTARLTRACPFTSNDEASYQINGKIAISKEEGKARLRPFE